ncbi:50S ribosomal protein L24 [bacterium]|nr:50S ribosomal protein L24 [bacterium]|tara:strand:+ start:30602 stop:30910 length:309 start_codon:yes stop_codon:yes gene_type:complete
MKIKKGDTVVIIAGKDRGKSGKVLRAIPTEDKVIIEGVNVAKRHQRSRRRGESGQIIDKTLPVHVSNVALEDPKSGKPTRIGIKRENGKRVRVAQKSRTIIK